MVLWSGRSTCTFKGEGKIGFCFPFFLFCCFFFSEIFVVTKNVKIER